MPTAPLRIVYMGTPDFAVPPLYALVQASRQPQARWQVVGVITAPDKPAGRGLQLQPSAVKTAALQLGFTLAQILQPTNLKSPEFLAQLEALNPQLQVVVAFRMLPQAVWALPALGTLNLHASLLPNLRGAAPIHWAVIHGEQKTGLTTFLLRHEIDTGDVLLQTEQEIPPNWHTGQLYVALMEKGPELVLQTVEGLIAGTLTPTPQNEALALHKAPKLTPENTRINWNVPAQQVYNTIRGLWHFPVAWTTLDAQRVKLPYPCSFRQEDPFASPGEFRLTNTGELEVAVADGVVCLPEIQMAGKRQMPCQDLFRGYTPQQYRFE